MHVSLLVGGNVIGDDVECVIVGDAVGKSLLSPSVVDCGKGRDEASVGVVGTCLVGFGSGGVVLVWDEEGVFGESASFGSVLVGAVGCREL